jgi:hypothetical protein
MKSEGLSFDVFGRRIDVERSASGWAAFVPGNDGKRRPAQIVIPSELKAEEIGRYLGDLFHESASARYPTVRQL